MRVSAQELIQDFNKALDLLQIAGPNPLLTDSDEYWDEFRKLMDKYRPQRDEEDDQTQNT